MNDVAEDLVKGLAHRHQDDDGNEGDQGQNQGVLDNTLATAAQTDGHRVILLLKRLGDVKHLQVGQEKKGKGEIGKMATKGMGGK